jgi:hypothetical protein
MGKKIHSYLDDISIDLFLDMDMDRKEFSIPSQNLEVFTYLYNGMDMSSGGH